MTPEPLTLQDVVDQAVANGQIASAALFVATGALGALNLAAASGIAGVALDRLVEAVGNPAHPIAQTLTDGQSTFNVLPMAAGGPALRSHVALFDTNGTGRAVGVLAVAHDGELQQEGRANLTALASSASGIVGAV